MSFSPAGFLSLFKKSFLILTACLLFEKESTSQILSAKPGNGIRFTATDSSFTLKLGARFQTQYYGQYSYPDETYTDGFLIRRARLKLEGFAYSPKLEYKLQFDFSNEGMGGSREETNNAANIILDAYAKWNFAKNLSLQFGQGKLPGNREENISSQDLQFVDRSLLNSHYSLTRDLGVQLHHQFAAGNVVFREKASIAMGRGRNVTAEHTGGYDYTGRVEVLPFGEFLEDGDYAGGDIEREEAPKLAIGFAYDYNAGAIREEGQGGAFFDESRTLKTIFADAMFKYRGFSLMTEYVDRKTSGSPVVETDGNNQVTQAFFTGKGFNIQAGYLFKNNYEIAGRYTSIHPQAVIQQPDNVQYTLGVSKYLAKHTVKVQSDISWLKADSDLDRLLYRVQVEIGF